MFIKKIPEQTGIFFSFMVTNNNKPNNMKKKLLLKTAFCFFVLLILAGSISAQQESTGKKIYPVKTAVVNFKELSDKEQLLPRNWVMAAKVPNEGTEYEEEPGPLVPASPATPTTPTGITVVSPSPIVNFQAAPDEAQGGGGSGTFNIPPDTYGAAGLDKLFVTVNNNYKVLNKNTGAQLSLVSMPSFWSSLGTDGAGAFDPRVIYDPYNNRWLHTAVSNGQNAASRILIAISQTHDPLGNYNLYAFDPDAGTANWADFPMLGFNKNWLAISVNLFTVAANANAGTAIVVIDYPAIRSGTVTATQLTPASGFCHYPVETYSETENTLYVPSHVGSGGATYKLSTITGTPAAPVFTLGATLTRAGGGWTQPSGNAGPQQCLSSCPGVLTLLDVGDAFIRSNAVFRNGEIWYAQAVGFPTGGFTRVSSQWTRLNTSGVVLDGGRVDDPTATATNGGRWYTYPSVSVNKNGDALTGFSKLESDGFAGGAYAMRLSTDAAGTMQDPVVFKDGEDYYDKASGGRTRWGDYSNVVVDPLDTISFWTWQEYAKLRAAPTVFSTTAKWGTWIAKVAPNPCLSAVASGNWNTAATWGCGSVPTASNNVTIISGQNVTLDINPLASSITVNEGATLTVNAARVLTCKLIVYGTLNITGGSLTLGNNDVFLSRNATLTGGSTTAFFITNGNGVVTKMIGGGTSFEFPLSANGTTYNGLVIALNAGDPEEVFSVGVKTGVSPASSDALSCVSRTWSIKEMKTGSNNATLTFKWTAADHGATYNPLVAATASRHNGTTWVLGSAMSIPSLASGIYSCVTSSTVSAFSPWVISSVGVIPVRVEYFTGIRQGTANLLNWKVACNSSAVTFNLERSADSRNFTGIYALTASDIRCLQPFNYMDQSPLSGINYYRIKMKDAEGKITYSSIVALLNKPKGFEIINLSPSVVSDGKAILNISSAQTQAVNIVVTGSTGNILDQFSHVLIAGSTQIPMDFSVLAAGSYVVSVYTADREKKSVRFIKY